MAIQIRQEFTFVESSDPKELVKLMEGRAVEGWALVQIVPVAGGTIYAFFTRQERKQVGAQQPSVKLSELQRQKSK